MIIYVYFDMDGVSAVWEGGKKRSHKRRFFLHRKLQKNVRDAMIILVERGYIIKNLTSAYKDGHSRQNKQTWKERKGVPGEIIFVDYGKDKAKDLPKSKKIFHFLIDDLSDNLRAFEKYGDHFIAIKFYNGINGTKGTWVGRRSVSHEMSAEEIADAIERYILEAVGGKEGCHAV
jgi:hypothetical protein